MNAVLIDTNIVSYLFKAHPVALHYRRHIENRPLAVSFMTVGELYEGAFRAGWGSPKWEKLEAALKTYVVIPWSDAICRHWGEIRAGRLAQPIAVDDAWIAATARAHGLPLVTHNPVDFVGIPGLNVITEVAAR